MKSKVLEVFIQKLVSNNSKQKFTITIIAISMLALLILGVFIGTFLQIPILPDWKDILLVITTAVVTNLASIVKWWFNNIEKDKELLARADAEDDSKPK
jgi:uncharacterized membrane protein YoaK (UPF0700 family)